MRLEHLFERRQGGDNNPKIDVYEFLKKYANDPEIYIHSTDVEKVGINPNYRDGHDSPRGIYAFKLKDIFKDSIERWNTGEYSGEKKRGIEFLPYYGGKYLYVLRATGDVISDKTYSESDLKKDLKKIQTKFKLNDDEMNKLKSAARTNLNFVDKPIGMLWGITKAIAAGFISEFDNYTPTDVKKWGKLLRDLGHESFNDTGLGWIHGAELGQALFLNSSAFQVVDLFEDQAKKRILIGDKSYQSPPKVIELSGFSSTFFVNNNKDDFAKVKEWKIKSIELADLKSLLRFTAPQSEKEIGQLVIDGFTFHGVKKLSADVLELVSKYSKRLKIETLMFSTTDPFQIRKFLEAMPDDLPVKEIHINGLMLDHYMWDDKDMADSIKKKIKPTGMFHKK